MRDTSGEPRWAVVLPNLLIAVAGAAALAVAAAGPLYRFQWLELGEAFLLMRTGAGVALALSAAGVLALIGVLRRPDARWRCLLALVVAAPAFLGPWAMMRTADQVPPIHDITTDLDDPPAFRALARERGSGENPSGYPGESVARQQRQAYEDIRPLRLEVGPPEAFRLSRRVAEGMGWRIAVADAGQGRIEAVATTPWWGFKDDVVVRIRPAADGARVDIRSVSRVGRSDLGQNAARIREFQQRLLRRIRG